MKEQLGLDFRTVQNGNHKSFSVQYTGSVNQNKFIAHLLLYYNISLCEQIIHSITCAENCQWHEDEYGPNSLIEQFDIEITPPNVTLNLGEFTIPMQDWKQLMIEWRDFQINNS